MLIYRIGEHAVLSRHFALQLCLFLVHAVGGARLEPVAGR
jgi:hypothetical protein